VPPSGLGGLEGPLLGALAASAVFFIVAFVLVARRVYIYIYIYFFFQEATPT